MRIVSRAEVIGVEGEAHWMERVRRRARLKGWDDYHVLDSTGMKAGWPDLALVRDEVLLLAELKTDVGQLTPAQKAFQVKGEQLRIVRFGVWRPRDEQTVWRLLE